MTQPLLTIVTRCCRRPEMLSDLIESVLRQTDKDIEQIFIVDKVGRHVGGNILWANRQLALNAHRVDGKYVLLKDDDTMLVSRRLVEDMRALMEDKAVSPDAFLVRSITGGKEHGSVHLLPPNEIWNLLWDNGERPKEWAGHGGNVIVRNELWKKHIRKYSNARNGGDWYFITSLLSEPRLHILKLDVIAGMSTQRGRGNYMECREGWWEEVVERYGIEQIAQGDWRLRLYEQN